MQIYIKIPIYKPVGIKKIIFFRGNISRPLTERILYTSNGTKRISDGTLVALTLMIAESRAEEKDIMLKVIVNLINKRDNECK